jgi:hypothetical protein
VSADSYPFPSEDRYPGATLYPSSTVPYLVISLARDVGYLNEGAGPPHPGLEPRPGLFPGVLVEHTDGDTITFKRLRYPSHLQYPSGDPAYPSRGLFPYREPDGIPRRYIGAVARVFSLASVFNVIRRGTALVGRARLTGGGTFGVHGYVSSAADRRILREVSLAAIDGVVDVAFVNEVAVLDSADSEVNVQ